MSKAKILQKRGFLNQAQRFFAQFYKDYRYLTIFAGSLLIFRSLAYYLQIIDGNHAAVLEQFGAFNLEVILHHFSMSLASPQWPKIIGSYVYDFSIPYAVSSDLNIAVNKPNIMPENVLPYGPLSYLIFYLFGKVEINTSLIIYRTISTILLAATIFISFKLLLAKSFKDYRKLFAAFFLTLLILFFSTPFYYFVSSGNIEIYLFILCLSALLLIDKYPKTSASLFATAAAIKYYPAIFLLIFIKRKRYDCFLLASFIAAILCFFPLFFLKGGVLDNFLFIANEVMSASKLCYLEAQLYCHTGGLSIAMGIYNLDIDSGARNITYEISAILILISGLFAFFKIKETAISLIPLITIFTLIPQVSVFYKLSYLLMPILLRNSNEFRLEKALIFALIGLSLSPIPFYLGLGLGSIKADFSLVLIFIHISALVHSFRNSGIIKK